MRYFPLLSHTYGPPSLFQASFSLFFIDIGAFSYAISTKIAPHFPIFCKTVFALRSRRTFFFCSLYFIISYIVFRSHRDGPPLARGPRRRPLLYAPSHPKAALPAARSIAPSFLFGNDSLLRAAAFRHTEKNLSPAARKKRIARRRPPMPCIPICSGAPVRWSARSASASERKCLPAV